MKNTYLVFQLNDNWDTKILTNKCGEIGEFCEKIFYNFYVFPNYVKRLPGNFSIKNGNIFIEFSPDSAIAYPIEKCGEIKNIIHEYGISEICGGFYIVED